MLDKDSALPKLREFMDPSFDDYLGDSTSKEQANERAIDSWSEAWYEMAKAVTPPSTTANAAKIAFEGTALAMNLDPTGLVFKLACDAFAETLCNGIAGHTLVPHIGQFQEVIPPGLTHEEECELRTDLMDAWLRSWKVLNITTSVEVPLS